MEYLRELRYLIAATAEVVRLRELPSPWMTISVALALAGAGWISTYYFARLWNRHYRLRPGHHLLCGLAAAVTLMAIPAWAITSYLQVTAEAVDQLWQGRIAADAHWQRETYARAYAAVRRLGVEDFGNVPAPGEPDSRIPLTQRTSVQIVSAIYARGAIAHFGTHFPRLRALVREEAERTRLSARMRRALEKSSASYPIEQVGRFAAASIGGGVLGHMRRWMRNAQLIVMTFAVGVHVLAFGVCGVSAYRDIQVHV